MNKELEEMKKRYKARLVFDPLKGRFRDYVTEIDCTSPCERLPDLYQRHLDGAWYEGQDKDKAWIEKTERELF